jgi:hypothetical protein
MPRHQPRRLGPGVRNRPMMMRRRPKTTMPAPPPPPAPTERVAPASVTPVVVATTLESKSVHSKIQEWETRCGCPLPPPPASSSLGQSGSLEVPLLKSNEPPYYFREMVKPPTTTAAASVMTTQEEKKTVGEEDKPAAKKKSGGLLSRIFGNKKKKDEKKDEKVVVETVTSALPAPVVASSLTPSTTPRLLVLNTVECGNSLYLQGDVGVFTQLVVDKMNTWHPQINLRIYDEKDLRIVVKQVLLNVDKMNALLYWPLLSHILERVSPLVRGKHKLQGVLLLAMDLFKAIVEVGFMEIQKTVIPEAIKFLCCHHLDIAILSMLKEDGSLTQESKRAALIQAQRVKDAARVQSEIVVTAAASTITTPPPLTIAA